MKQFRRRKYEEVIAGVIQALQKHKKATLATIHEYLLTEFISHNKYSITLKELAFLMRYLRKTGKVHATYNKRLKVYIYELSNKDSE